MKYWKEIAIFFIGVSTALIAILKFQKPTTVNNVDNEIKIKNNKAPISDITLDNTTETTKEPQVKKERRKWLKKLFKRKNK